MLRTLFRYLMSSEWLRRHVYGTFLYDFNIMVKQRVKYYTCQRKRAEFCRWWVGGSPVLCKQLGS